MNKRELLENAFNTLWREYIRLSGEARGLAEGAKYVATVNDNQELVKMYDKSIAENNAQFEKMIALVEETRKVI